MTEAKPTTTALVAAPAGERKLLSYCKKRSRCQAYLAGTCPSKHNSDYCWLLYTTSECKQHDRQSCKYSHNPADKAKLIASQEKFSAEQKLRDEQYAKEAPQRAAAAEAKKLADAIEAKATSARMIEWMRQRELADAPRRAAEAAEKKKVEEARAVEAKVANDLWRACHAMVQPHVDALRAHIEDTYWKTTAYEHAAEEADYLSPEPLFTLERFQEDKKGQELLHKAQKVGAAAQAKGGRDWHWYVSRFSDTCSECEGVGEDRCDWCDSAAGDHSRGIYWSVSSSRNLLGCSNTTYCVSMLNLLFNIKLGAPDKLCYTWGHCSCHKPRGYYLR
ncbi:Hypothetical protein POVN_LOCUS684 [uncultured virus]|nr:Hypothetical protein POVN_LOCUS684 [uncultured virus]